MSSRGVAITIPEKELIVRLKQYFDKDKKSCPAGERRGVIGKGVRKRGQPYNLITLSIHLKIYQLYLFTLHPYSRSTSQPNPKKLPRTTRRETRGISTGFPFIWQKRM